MKKLITTLCAVIALGLYSCSNDESESLHYLDNKLIEGTWVSITPSSNGLYTIDSVVYIFKDNKATYKSYTHILGLDTLKLEEDTYLGPYLINDSTVFYSIHSQMNQQYKLNRNSSDSLFLQHPHLATVTYWLGLKRLKE